VDPAIGTGRELAERMLRRGILVKDTHGATIRFAPPLVVEPADLDWAMDEFEAALSTAD
jgi:ornithine--oxo-acid transaminase